MTNKGFQCNFGFRGSKIFVIFNIAYPIPGKQKQRNTHIINKQYVVRSQNRETNKSLHVDMCLIDLQYVELRVCNRNQERNAGCVSRQIKSYIRSTLFLTVFSLCIVKVMHLYTFLLDHNLNNSKSN